MGNWALQCDLTFPTAWPVVLLFPPVDICGLTGDLFLMSHRSARGHHQEIKDSGGGGGRELQL